MFEISSKVWTDEVLFDGVPIADIVSVPTFAHCQLYVVLRFMLWENLLDTYLIYRYYSRY